MERLGGNGDEGPQVYQGNGADAQPNGLAQYPLGGEGSVLVPFDDGSNGELRDDGPQEPVEKGS